MTDNRSLNSSRRQVFICGATQTYYGDESGWWKYDWLRRKLTRGGSPRIPPLCLIGRTKK